VLQKCNKINKKGKNIGILAEFSQFTAKTLTLLNNLIIIKTTKGKQ